MDNIYYPYNETNRIKTVKNNKKITRIIGVLLEILLFYANKYC